jgi:hypothetical protein
VAAVGVSRLPVTPDAEEAASGTRVPAP